MAIPDAIQVGQAGLIHYSELVRLIAQCLLELGLSGSAAVVENESRISAESHLVRTFRKQILDGNWNESVATLRRMELPPDYNVDATAATILEQKFFQILVATGSIIEALKTLRSEITPLNIERETVHGLACNAFLPSAEIQLKFIKNRDELIQNLLPHSVLLPERRLVHLLEQHLIQHKKKCLRHNSPWISLLSDARNCDFQQIPTTTVQVLEVHTDEVWCVQFSHNGKFLASGSKDCTAIIWELTDRDYLKLKYVLRGHQKPVVQVAWSANDQMILTCGYQEVLKLWSIDSGNCMHTYDQEDGSFSACAWFPNGERFVANDTKDRVHVWTVESNPREGSRRLRGPTEMGIAPFKDLTVTADGKHVYCLCKDGVLDYDVETGKGSMYGTYEGLTSLCLSKDDRCLLLNCLENEILIHQVGTASCMTFTGHRQTRSVIRSCFGGLDENFVASGSEDSQVYIWHQINLELLQILAGHAGVVNCVSWNPVKLSMIASASNDYTIRIWGTCEEALNRSM